MKTAANRWLAIIDRISFFGSYLTGVVFLSAIVVLVTLEVILRYLFNTSTMLADEFSTYLFVGLLYFGAAYALQKDRHIKINIIAVASCKMRLLIGISPGTVSYPSNAFFRRFSLLFQRPVPGDHCMRKFPLL